MRLILCADDYALTPAVSDGILALARDGRLSAVGCMTNRPHWPLAAPALLPLRGPRLAVGLHLNLTLGPPLANLPRLAPGGVLPPFNTLLRWSLLGLLPKTDLIAEIERQLDAFEDEAGTPPDFVDGHQHVHVLPGVRAALFDVLTRRGLQARTWLRDPADSWNAIAARGVATAKALVIATLARGFGDRARALGFATNRGFAGVSPFDPKSGFAGQMARFLVAPGPDHLVMCHPGFIDPALRRLDPVVETRPIEQAFFASPDWDAMRETHGIELVACPRPA